MNYTLAGLVSILRQRLQDEEFDETALKTFLNEAQSEILGEDKYPFMQRIDVYSDIQSGEVNLPPEYGGTFALYACHDKGQRKPLRYIAPEDFFAATIGKNFVYTTFANTLFYRIHGKMDDPKDNRYTITHLYLANPWPLVKDDDHSCIPPQYIEALILGALARAEQRRDNFDYAQIYRNEQDSIVTNMKLRYGPGNLTAENTAKLPFFGGYADGRH